MKQRFNALDLKAALFELRTKYENKMNVEMTMV
jgi:hypothetical protein